MRTETRVVLFAAGFVGVVTAVYWFTSYEDAGTTMLGLGALAYLFLTSYLFLQARRLRPGDRPEDAEDPGVGDPGAPTEPVEVGYFPAASVWPASLALGAVLTGLGLVFGYWFFAIAAIFFVGGIIGYAVEAQAVR